MDLKDIRLEYTRKELNRELLHQNPIEQITAWFQDARESQIEYLNAATLSTVNEKGFPSGRIVLLKEITEGGAIFFTNYDSDKGKEISLNPKVSLCIFWKELDRQIRLSGTAEKISERESLEYFQTRPRESQISAHASHQSSIVTKEELDQAVEKFQNEFKSQDIPLPKNWGGYRVILSEVEVWQGRPNRLHDRFQYTKSESEWVINRLAP